MSPQLNCGLHILTVATMRLLITALLSLLLGACSVAPKVPYPQVSRAPQAVVDATPTEKFLTASSTYVTYAELLPTSNYFEILKPINCDHWFWLSELREASQVQGNPQYYIRNHATSQTSWPAQCFSKMHEILQTTDDPVLKRADGVIFDYKQYRIVNQGTPIIGYHHVFMPGWAIRFKEATSEDILQRLRTLPQHILDLRQIEAAAKAAGRMGLKDAVPLLDQLIRPQLAVQESLRDNKTSQAILEGLALMPPEFIDQEMWWQLLESGSRVEAGKIAHSTQLRLAGYSGAAAMVASRALYCANPPGLHERMIGVYSTTLERDRMLAAAMALAAIDPNGFDQMQRTIGAAAGSGMFSHMVKSQVFFQASECPRRRRQR